MKARTTLVAAALLLPGTLYGESISRDDLPGMSAECERQRQEQIAPLREEAIQECVDVKRGDREFCERYNRDFGEATPLAGGGMRPGLFYELPVCEQAYAAEKYLHMNPGEDTYEAP